MTKGTLPLCSQLSRRDTAHGRARAAPRSSRIRRRGNPVLGWIAANGTVREDQNENFVPAKKTSTGRIDDITAPIIALSRAMLDPTSGSIYNRRPCVTTAPRSG